jgi:hypothetical protein
MADVTHGTITIQIPDELALPAKAGSMSPEEVARIPKPPKGIGYVCAQTAKAIETAGERFSAPKGVTPTTLAASGARADDIDQFLVDLEVVRQMLQQGNLMFDADAWDQLRKVNDQVKAQAKHDPGLIAMFQPLIDFLAKGPRGPKGGGGGGGGGPPAGGASGG